MASPSAALTTVAFPSARFSPIWPMFKATKSERLLKHFVTFVVSRWVKQCGKDTWKTRYWCNGNISITKPAISISQCSNLHSWYCAATFSINFQASIAHLDKYFNLLLKSSQVHLFQQGQELLVSRNEVSFTIQFDKCSSAVFHP